MAGTALLGRLTWQLGEVTGLVQETPRVGTLRLLMPEWPGHLAGQHVDVRLTADDGYQAQRSYSIASAPDDSRLAITVERLEDGEVSPYLVGELKVGDKLELRGPIGGYFVRKAAELRSLPFIPGPPAIAPLLPMIRHPALVAAKRPARLLYCAGRAGD